MYPSPEFQDEAVRPGLPPADLVAQTRRRDYVGVLKFAIGASADNAHTTRQPPTMTKNKRFGSGYDGLCSTDKVRNSMRFCDK